MKNALLLFLCLLATGALFSQTTASIQCAWGSIQLEDNFEQIKAGRLLAPDEPMVHNRVIRLLHFEQILDAHAMELLQLQDVVVLEYLHPAAYLVSLPGQMLPVALAPLRPKGMTAVQPVWKLSKTLLEPPYGAWAVHGEWLDVNLQVYPHVSIESAAAMCQDNGMIVLKKGTQNGVMQLRVLQDELLMIAALPFVQYLELAPPPSEKEDNRGRALHRANALDSSHPLGKKYDGTGVKALVRDDGQVGPHIDFSGRLINKASQPNSFGVHGDAVSGILGGAGNLNPYMRGMAPGATLYTVDYDNGFQDITLSLHQIDSVTITNTSYSDGCNTGYTLASQTVDKQMYDNATLFHVFSAGNSNGLSDCGYGAGNQWANVTGGHKMAKNAIAVANLDQFGVIDPESSRGPAHDGRIKPEIAANGTNQMSTDDNNVYLQFGGTSGAAPGVAGCLVQLTHAYKNMHNGAVPEAALLKAVVLNSANDLGNTGPDFIYGFGHINARKALSILENNQYIAASVAQGATNEHTLTAPPGVQEIKVMVVWSDRPASPNASRALVNDLDLRLESSGGNVFLPWKLNATPNPTILNTPAGKGRDSLNNVEQVSITTPAPGTYTVKVTGNNVPFGPQRYHLVWEFISPEVTLTYPSGGEGLAPGSTVRVHWDAHDTNTGIELLYSTANNQPYTTIASLPGTARMYDWVVPNTISGQTRLLLVQGNERDTIDWPCSIVSIPANVAITQLCPDSMTISWTDIQDSLSYEVYQLGAKYMEIIGASNTNQLVLPVADAGAPRWIAVRATHPGGLTGERSNAIYWPGGLIGCPQTNDLAVGAITSPSGDAIVTCFSAEQPVSVVVRNEGIDVMEDATVSYQVNTGAVVTELLPALAPGQSLPVTFQTPLTLSGNGVIQLKVWTNSPVDMARFNDTIVLEIPVVTDAIGTPFTETFETTEGVPLGWVVGNPDGGITWVNTANLFPVIGKTGDPSNTMFMNHFLYNKEGELDHLYMVPIDLSGYTYPQLSFDVAHRRYNNSYSEGLRVEIFPGCNLNDPPVVLYDKIDPALATVINGTGFYVPGAETDWRRDSVDLTPYVGQKAVVRFVSVNDYGNNTYLDNISVASFEPPVPPIAAITASDDTICRQDTAYFSANILSANTGYSWNFGAQAFPTSASGAGPHQVYYPSSGTKNIRLIASTPLGFDTAFHVLTVLPFPLVNFAYASSNLTVTFTNATTNADTYLWDFGDGTTSTEANPVHTYALAGTYNVVLSATSACRTNTKTATVTLTTSGVQEQLDHLSAQVLPNPAAGDFVLYLEGTYQGALEWRLFDAQGCLIRSQSTTLAPGATSLPISAKTLPAGVYQLTLRTAEGSMQRRIVRL